MVILLQLCSKDSMTREKLKEGEDIYIYQLSRKPRGPSSLAFSCVNLELLQEHVVTALSVESYYRFNYAKDQIKTCVEFPECFVSKTVGEALNKPVLGHLAMQKLSGTIQVVLEFFVEIQFDANGKISGAAIRAYLVERSRVCQISDPERNYHCFCMLCSAPSETSMVA
ncbi:hypothetical protein ZEAMMB73_Zm00001d003690 [Zea mays]|uniref:Uncharacterized protein n=1 Tax=Zea mays TaxID=4577 RepID=A0A1D6EAY7_MAIZE|nr:hypothetical protein ZEAMMB73_Zm00001d003690 [Zea mays]